MRRGHSAIWKNHRVIVRLTDGTVIVDRFVKRDGAKRWVWLKKYGKVAVSEIRGFAPYREASTVHRRKGRVAK